MQKEIITLIEQLLAQPFARANGFTDLNLDQVGKILEEARELLTHAERTPESVQARQSHDECVGLYCMILMDLEQIGASMPETSLAQMAGRQETVQILTEIPPVPEEDESPSPPPPPSISTFEAVEILPTPTPETGGTFEELGSAPDMPEKLFNEAETSATGSPHEKEIRALSARMLSSRGREHIEIGLYFQLARNGSFPFAPEHADRLSGQSFCFGLEAECALKLAPALADFWPRRESAVRALLDNEIHRFEFRREVRAALDRLAADHADWLLNGRIPYAGMLGSLRYLIAAVRLDTFQPSLMEFATLLLFFGHDPATNDAELTNLLRLEGVEAAEILELAFRASRMHRARVKLLAPTVDIAPADLDLLQQDLKRILTLLVAVGARSGESLERAA